MLMAMMILLTMGIIMRVLDLREEIRMLNPRKNGSAVTKKKKIMVNTINIIIQC